MFKPVLILPLLAFLGTPAFLQQAPSPSPNAPKGAAQAAPQASAIPAEYVTMVNPVKPTPESQARAKQIYSWDCAACHGDNGNGKGDVAVEQKLKIPDYRDPAALKHLTDGQMFYIIHHGQGNMPGEGPRAKTDEVWNLVIYLRQMSGTPSSSAAPAQAAQ